MKPPDPKGHVTRVNRLPLKISVGLLLPLLGLVGIAIVIASASPNAQHSPSWILCSLGIAAWVLTIYGIGLFYNVSHYRTTRSCWTIEDAEERMGLPRATLDRIIATSQLRPVMIVDGVPVYQPDQLTTGAKLLRPAGSSGDDSLLRADSSQGRETDTLVRPVVDADQVSHSLHESE